jgi:chromosome transmission fidelity protein 4
VSFSSSLADISFVRGELELSTLREAADPFGEIADLIRSRQVELDKELLQLVMSACKADKIQRALDITRLMFNPATLEAAIKIAVFYQLPGLKDRIEQVLKAKERRRGGEKRAQRYEPVREDSPPLAAPARATASAAKHLTEFVPRNGGPRRSYGATPTPMLPPARSESYIPETPTETQDDPLDDSPPGKRKRDEREQSVEEVPSFDEAPKKRPEPVVAQREFIWR